MLGHSTCAHTLTSYPCGRLWAWPAPSMPHQIDLFCMPQLADTCCLEADHNGGTVRVPFDLRSY